MYLKYLTRKRLAESLILMRMRASYESKVIENTNANLNEVYII